MTGSCLCGSVEISILEKPDFINECNCTLCRKTGAAWGYFSSAQVHTSGKTVSIMRADKNDPFAEVHSCDHCASTTHYTISKSYTDKHGPSDMVGVNMYLFNLNDLKGVEVRFPNGKDWPGQGEFGYRREAVTLGGDHNW